MAELNDISFYKGEAISLVFTMTPVTDITGWTIVRTIKNNNTDTAALLTQAAVLTTPLTGIFTFTLAHAQTVSLTGDTNYAYDIQRTDSGSEAVLSIGTLLVTQEVLY